MTDNVAALHRPDVLLSVAVVRHPRLQPFGRFQVHQETTRRILLLGLGVDGERTWWPILLPRGNSVTELDSISFAVISLPFHLTVVVAAFDVNRN